MNEQLQSKLVEVLAGIQAATKAAGDFAMEQLPDIAQSYVMYGRAMHTTGIVVGLLMFAVLLWFLPRAIRGMEDADVWPVPVYMVGVPVAGIVLMVNFGPAMLVWFAPKVWLLQQLASLIK